MVPPLDAAPLVRVMPFAETSIGFVADLDLTRSAHDFGAALEGEDREV